MRSINFLLVAGAVALIAATPASAQSLNGKTVGITWLFPDSSTSYTSRNVVVGPGAEVTCAGGNVGPDLCQGFVVGSQFDLGSNTLGYLTTSGSSSWNPASFNGYSFGGLSAGGVWTGFSLSTTIAGLDASRVTFTPDKVFINMQGLPALEGQGFTITLLSSAVPEPATWAIMTIGFGAIGFAMRRRKAMTSVSYAV